MHDLTVARVWGIVREPTASGPVVPDDKGDLGEDCIRTPYRGRNKARRRPEGHQPVYSHVPLLGEAWLPRAPG